MVKLTILEKELKIIYNELKAIKDKYTSEMMKIDGTYGIGIQVLSKKILLFIYKEEAKKLLPPMLDGFETEIVYSETIPKALDSKYQWMKDINEKHYNGGLGGGSSIGQHYTGRNGTLGSWWYSKKFNKPVFLSNNHVLAGVDNGRIPELSNTVSFTYVTGGTPFSGNSINDSEIVFSPESLGEKMNKPNISSITPSSAKAGEIVTIRGRNLGHRKGYSKVFFGDKEAIVKSWSYVPVTNEVQLLGSAYSKVKGTVTFTGYYQDTIEDKERKMQQTIIQKQFDCTIEVYVPENAESQVYIETEGDPIYSPGYSDNGRIKDTKAMLLDYFPYYGVGEGDKVDDLKLGRNILSTPKINGTMGGFTDVAIATVHDYRMVNQDIMQYSLPRNPAPYPYEMGWYNTDKNTYWEGEGQTFTPKGRFTGMMVEGMVVKKVGRSTGTTFGYVTSPSTNVWLTYEYANDTVKPKFFKDCISIASLSYGMPFVYAGDSGSSLFTAKIADYVDWVNYYNIPNNYDYKGTLIESEENLFIGNCFGASGLLAYADKNHNYWDYWQLAPLQENWFPFMETKAKLKSNLNITLDISANITSNSEISMVINLSNAVALKTMTAAKMTPVSYETVNFSVALASNEYVLNATYESLSEVTCSVEAYSNPLDITVVITGSSSVTSVIENYNIYHDIRAAYQGSSSVYCNVGSSNEIGIDFQLQSILLATDLNNISFNLETTPQLINAAMESSSLVTMAVEVITIGVIDIVASVQSSSTMKMITDIYLSVGYSGSSSLSGVVYIPFSTLELLVSVSSNTSVVATVVMLPIGWSPNTEYKEIHFTITRSLDINLEIKRSLELNLAV